MGVCIFLLGETCQFDSSATAAWVQAIGSVAAIAAAVWIDRGSARRALSERQAASAATEAGAIAAASKNVDALGWLLEEIQAPPGSPPNRACEAILRTWDGALSYYLARELRAELVSTLLFARQRNAVVLAAVDRMYERHNPTNQAVAEKEVEDAIRDLSHSIDEATGPGH
jgi:hypothetical protein